MTFSAAINKVLARRERAQTAVESAIRSGRLLAAQREWAVEYCTRYPAGFQTFVAAAPVFEDHGDGTVTAHRAHASGLRNKSLGNKRSLR